MAYHFQAPKDFDAQSAKFKKQFKTLAEVQGSGHHEIQLKYDGVFSVIDTDRAIPQTRQLEDQPAAQHLAEEARKIFGGGKLVFLELWNPGTLHQELNGLSRRHEVQPTLQGQVFDAISKQGFVEGSYKVPYLERRQLVEHAIRNSGMLHPVHVLELVAGVDLVKAATKLGDDEVDAYDGLIVRDTRAIWTPGASKNGEVIKVKPCLTLDLEVTAQHAEVRATKLGGFLTVNYKGKPTDVGSGLTQDDLRAIMAYQEGAAGGVNFVSKIAEIECLGVTPQGKLREPRLKTIRFDAVKEEDKPL